MLTQALRRVRRVLRRLPPPAPPPIAAYDGWLALLDDELAPIEAACAAGERDMVALFSGLDVDLWALLLTQQYSAYPHIRALLPSVPEPPLQERWNGLSGAPLAQQTAAFYRLLRERAGARWTARACSTSAAAGGGSRASSPATCRPSACTAAIPSSRSSTSAARTACRRRSRGATSSPSGCRSTSRSTSRTRSPSSRTCPRRRTSAASRRCTTGCDPDGILVATIRPPAYLDESPLMEPVRDRRADQYIFAPHMADPSHPQYAGPRDALRRDRDRASLRPRAVGRWFELLHVDLLLGDMYQVVLTLRRAG